jgi:hypothetical protein
MATNPVPAPRPERYNPLPTLAVTAGALLIFVTIFTGFLLAPMVILGLFYLTYTMINRARNGRHAKADPQESVGAYVPEQEPVALSHDR